jgi:hypothetical protein
MEILHLTPDSPLDQKIHSVIIPITIILEAKEETLCDLLNYVHLPVLQI